MKKLIFAALGYAAYRWLSAPSSQSSNNQADRNSSSDNRSDASLSARERRREKRQRMRDEEDSSSTTAAPASSSKRKAASINTDKTPESQGETGQVIYQVVEHDEGWAYKVGDVFSETYPSHDTAKEAAEAAARAQEQAGEPEPIEYQDEDGKWRQEDSDGNDRPHTDVEDTQPRMG